ncbi:MAG: group II intron reverse transcriptase/maturase [Candidatus Methylomirabilales bacterium]
MRLQPPDSARTLQRKLYRKAKQEPAYRFYLLYDKVYRADLLGHAWALVRANGGAPGIDGVSIAAVEADGVEGFLARIAEELRTHTYRPDPVRRVPIPKRRGGERPLGIPTVRDRVVQTAARLVLEPIFEADFQPCSYGYRPKKDAHQALEEVSRYLLWGYTQVLDADLAAFFDSIPHHDLLAHVARRVADRHILRLLKGWLRAPVVVERDGGKTETRGGQRTRRGTPQGGAISPLLANIYLHRFDTAWRVEGLERRLQARLIRYADDFVVLCKRSGEPVRAVVTAQLQALGLTLNPAKTRVLAAQREAFTFLGFTVRLARSGRTGGWFALLRPSAAARQRLRDKVKGLTDRSRAPRPTPAVIAEVNRVVQGWAGYFHFKHCARDFSNLRRFVEERVRTYLRRKHRHRTRGYRAFPNAFLYQRLGLYRLPDAPPWLATAHASR